MVWMPRGCSICTCHICPCHLRSNSPVMHNFSSSIIIIIIIIIIIFTFWEQCLLFFFNPFFFWFSGLYIVLWFFYFLIRHDFFSGHNFYCLINLGDCFFFNCLSFFYFNCASFFNKAIWVNLYKLTFSIPPFFHSQPNKNEGN